MTTTHRITSALAATALALTVATAQASARPIEFTPRGSLVLATTTVPAAPPSDLSQPHRQAAIVRVTSGGGFDWGDAGIGAAGGLAISMLAVGGGLIVTERRRSHAAAS